MTLARFLSPLTSLVIFILGHGMFNTLLTVRLSAEQVSAQAIGLVSTAYFGGLVLGPSSTPASSSGSVTSGLMRPTPPCSAFCFCCTAWWWSR